MSKVEPSAQLCHSNSDSERLNQLQQKMIDDLQVKVAFLDDLVEQLNAQVALQNQQLSDLKQQMQLLYRRVEAADVQDGIAAFDVINDKPPHF